MWDWSNERLFKINNKENINKKQKYGIKQQNNYIMLEYYL